MTLFNKICFGISEILHPDILCTSIGVFYKHKSASYDCRGKIIVGAMFNDNIKYQKHAHLILNEKSHLYCEGDFKIFAGSKIAVAKNGRLDIRGGGYLNFDSKIYVFNHVVIGKNVSISENVIIRDSDNHKIVGNSEISSPIIIGDNVWIGMNVTILKGVQIGEGAIIGAGAVVTRDIPAYSLAVGVPARVIKNNVSMERE